MKQFEVQVPYHQYLVYRIDALNAKEAIKMVLSGFDKEGKQITEECSLGCGPNAKLIVREIEG